jgi:hypothetical protein
VDLIVDADSLGVDIDAGREREGEDEGKEEGGNEEEWERLPIPCHTYPNCLIGSDS